MPNMSYCRFENTLNDLRDCLEHLYEKGLSKDEKRMRNALIELCREIADSDEGDNDAR